ncbi:MULTISPECIES: porin [unclassified Acinetobacter]|uniref:porin n=1 Tax=unclassified Acinetobacter TaxID=196816 RepID=UPI002935286C|nr:MULTISPECIES: porin [unclassified Acinetobacter]WOE31926.1 porin [Acinetobacter sp. SAAs470]WOE37393.1 porin [Acinetobacter sp. SAAs474]
MKKVLCALTAGATLMTPVFASAADVKIYGRAHVSLDYLNDSQDYKEVALSSNSSRLGFKVEQKLQNDMTAFAQIESQINFSSGSDDGDSVDFSTRDTFVGVKSNYGQLKIGRFDSPFKAARGPINYFGDMVGDLRTITRAYNHRFDERNPNTIEYKSPDFANGFNVVGALSLHNGTMIYDKGDEKNNKSKAYDVGLNYKNSVIKAAAAYEHYQEDADSQGKRNGFRVSAEYKATPKLNLAGFYQYTALDNKNLENLSIANQVRNADANVFGIATDYKITDKTSVRGQVFYRHVDADDANSTLIAAGIEHKLDPAFRVYANLATMLNDRNANLTPWNQARSNKAGSTQGVDATGENPLALSLGMRYDF